MDIDNMTIAEIRTRVDNLWELYDEYDKIREEYFMAAIFSSKSGGSPSAVNGLTLIAEDYARKRDHTYELIEKFQRQILKIKEPL